LFSTACADDKDTLARPQTLYNTYTRFAGSSTDARA
jgi:hypothetical protein